MMCHYAYSSQRYNKCGWTQKSNKDKKRFKCKHCNNTINTDINAAINLTLNLRKITYAELRDRKTPFRFFLSRTGAKDVAGYSPCYLKT